ncbi:hypothetical protein NQZ68_020394 [Dissostichus eleginoides]|nr:hypothetical protein NQZ68_020394 [Dissostichus eleginoides]
MTEVPLNAKISSKPGGFDARAKTLKKEECGSEGQCQCRMELRGLQTPRKTCDGLEFLCEDDLTDPRAEGERKRERSSPKSPSAANMAEAYASPHHAEKKTSASTLGSEEHLK